MEDVSIRESKQESLQTLREDSDGADVNVMRSDGSSLDRPIPTELWFLSMHCGHGYTQA